VAFVGVEPSVKLYHQLIGRNNGSLQLPALLDAAALGWSTQIQQHLSATYGKKVSTFF
jgi:hypothetical protein